ncbi:transcriptional regulator, TetR family [Leptospira ryugenii]|uniref:Transcriptional regulator, TetR family n=1 Tax=Leptospira ryugenii TaxID=1917863 RepID=A0A2P2DVM4_9LEPT|nr:TetR/AcrR family transcriptional regulator [Leptospira ryugenii]GBF48699.1 transcriptional regulator, TetR family [Leptospira ryugenii]
MPKIVDHDLYRIELLEKCMPIFVKKGVSAVSMRELSRELGVSTGTLYHYFPTKETLFGAMVRLFVGKDAEEIAKLNSASKSAWDLLNYLSAKEAHFINLMLLAVDVNRHHSESEELTGLLEESWNSYKTVLSAFFSEHLGEKNENDGEAFLSFVVGTLFLKLSRKQNATWLHLFEGLGDISGYFKKMS